MVTERGLLHDRQWMIVERSGGAQAEPGGEQREREQAQAEGPQPLPGPHLRPGDAAQVPVEELRAQQD